MKLFGDTADVDAIARSAASGKFDGYTTNPTLMRAAGVSDYESFGRGSVEAAAGRPISFEVVTDDANEMFRQAQRIASWGPEVYVKIPVVDTSGLSTSAVIAALAGDGVHVNVTGVLTLHQVEGAAAALFGGATSIISVFAGRIADTGRDPIPLMATASELVEAVCPTAEILWASVREVLNIVQARDAGCSILTLPEALWPKLELAGRDLKAYSIQTVADFLDDAVVSGLEL